MKLTLPNFTQNPTAFIRTCGYAFDRNAGDEISFIRRVAGYDYPRFHLYIKSETNNDQLKTKNLIINLHIDQKKPTYGSHTAHSGEYDGELVSAEIERIKILASSIPRSQLKN